MSESKYTPGPWEVYRAPSGRIDVRQAVNPSEDGETVARCIGTRAAQDAPLVAAAPEMVEALNFVWDALTRLNDGEAIANLDSIALSEELTDMQNVVGAARALLTRVEGR